MKYRFVKKSKAPKPADIKSQMDFAQMLAKSKGLVGAKISSAALSGGITAKSAVIIGASAVTLSVSGVVVYQEIQKQAANIEPTPKEILVEPQPDLITDTLSTAVDTLPFEEKEEETKVAETQERAQPEEKVEEQQEEPPTQEVKERDESLLYDDVIIKASPMPSKAVFLKYVYEELTYPQEYIADSIQGVVDVRFKVNKKGEVDDFKISKSLGEVFDNEAIRVIRSYSPWKPATYNGEAVDSYLQLTVTFQIEK